MALFRTEGTADKHDRDCDDAAARSQPDWSSKRAPAEPTGERVRKASGEWTEWKDERDCERWGSTLCLRSSSISKGVESTVPEDLIWDKVPRFASEAELQKRLARFTTKCWTSQLTETRRVPDSTPIFSRIEAFVKGWVSDAVYRLFQSYDGAQGGMKDHMSTQLISDFFAELCSIGALPQGLTCNFSNFPPSSWGAVPRSVTLVFDGLYPLFTFERAHVPDGVVGTWDTGFKLCAEFTASVASQAAKNCSSFLPKKI